MSLSLSRLVGLSASGLAAVFFALPAWATAQEAREIVIGRLVLDGKDKDDDDDKEEKEDKDDDDKDEDKRESFWLGIALEGEGSLKIAEVLPGSPALKAGLQGGDTVVAVGDKKIEKLEQLVDLIQDSKGRELKLKYLRDGKEHVTEVHPVKRPGARVTEEKEEKEEKKPGQSETRNRKVEVAPEAGIAPQGSGTMHLYTLPKGAPGGTASSSSAYPPGTPGSHPMMGRMAISFPQSQLPDDMEVTISKQGNQPATVTARQGKKLWKTTENELDMLPPPAQAYASRALGKDVLRTRLPGAAPGMGGAMMPGMGGMPGMPGMGGAAGMPGMPGMGGMPGMPGKVIPGSGIRLEIREGHEEGKTEEKKSKFGKAPEDKDDPQRAERIRGLQEQAENLRALLNKLREEVKEKEEKKE